MGSSWCEACPGLRATSRYLVAAVPSLPLPPEQLHSSRIAIGCSPLPPLDTSRFVGLFPPRTSSPLPRLWTSTTIVAAKLSSRSFDSPPIQAGVRCDRCKIGPIVGPCFRCAAGCGSMATCRGAAPTAPTRIGRSGRGRESAESPGKGYTLCEACFGSRGRFHPPHPFARLAPGFADVRLSGPALYEAM